MLHQANKSQQVRPDLEVAFPILPSNNVTFAVDLSICCPFEGSQVGAPVVSIQNSIDNDNANGVPKNYENKIANKRVSEKKNKYDRICKQKGCRFVPFIMYSTGRIHKHACKFLYQLANHAKDIRNLPQNTLMNYYVKLLNFALIKEATHTICVKSHEIGSYMRNANSNVRAEIRVGNNNANEIANPPIVVYPYARGN